MSDRTVKIPRDIEAWGAIRALQQELQQLRKSYEAHLAHAHGIFGTDATRTTYVGIREKIKKVVTCDCRSGCDHEGGGYEQDSEGSATADTD